MYDLITPVACSCIRQATCPSVELVGKECNPNIKLLCPAAAADSRRDELTELAECKGRKKQSVKIE